MRRILQRDAMHQEMDRIGIPLKPYRRSGGETGSCLKHCRRKAVMLWSSWECWRFARFSGLVGLASRSTKAEVRRA